MSAPSPTRSGHVLSIQSQVSYGHVGNSAATLPLQRLGFDVIPINTVQLAHHPGHGHWCGHKVEPERLAEILEGVAARGALAQCLALMSGYLGDAAVGPIVLDALTALRAARPDALYLCDPVIGDDGPGVFVSAGIPEYIRDRLLPAADIVTPNRFELEWLTDRPVASLDDAREAARVLLARGPKLVVVTGLPAGEGLCVLAEAMDGAWEVTTPRLVRGPDCSGHIGGAGDAFCALLLGHYLRTGVASTALERAVSAMFDLIALTYESSADELRLVAAQDGFNPVTPHYGAKRLS